MSRDVIIEGASLLRAITFDFWGTIYDNGPDLTPLYLQVLAAELPGKAPGSLRSALARAQKLAARVGQMGFRLSVEARVAVILDELDTSASPDRRKRLVQGLEEAILDSPPNPIQGGRHVMEFLRREGYILALISDTGMHPGKVIRRLMDRDGLLEYFQYLTFSDELGVNKRWRQPFLSTCAAIGVAPEETLHVGDLPDTDIRSAKAAGCHTVLATYVSKRLDWYEAPDAVLSNLADFPSVLAQLLERG